MANGDMDMRIVGVAASPPGHSDETANSLAADAGSVPNAEDEAYQIGRRDGYELAIQTLDIHTGGDGEFTYCLGAYWPERHCPDAGSMMLRIIDRFNNLRRAAQGGEARQGGDSAASSVHEHPVGNADAPNPQGQTTASENPHHD